MSAISTERAVAAKLVDAVFEAVQREISDLRAKLEAAERERDELRRRLDGLMSARLCGEFAILTTERDQLRAERDALEAWIRVFAYVAAYLLAELPQSERANARKVEAIDDAIHEVGVCPDCQTEPVN